jgi:hypothetical protein
MSYLSFSGRHTPSIKIDPTAGGYVPRKGHSMRELDAACDRFLRQREPGYAAAREAIAATRKANKPTAPNPHARG